VDIEACIFNTDTIRYALSMVQQMFTQTQIIVDLK